MITIIDYGLGNINAFKNIYSQLDIECMVANDAQTLRKATKIILPGVGAFDFAMKSLNRSGMRDALDELVLDKNIPLLGICVGMQMLANSSEEGILPGLGYIDGRVRKFNKIEISSNPLPHMGWNLVDQKQQEELFKNIKSAERFYFLHSYYFDCVEESQKIASAHYGINFSCGVRKNNISGVQFHPEKSHGAGMKLLSNFGLM